MTALTRTIIEEAVILRDGIHVNDLTDNDISTIEDAMTERDTPLDEMLVLASDRDFMAYLYDEEDGNDALLKRIMAYPDQTPNETMANEVNTDERCIRLDGGRILFVNY